MFPLKWNLFVEISIAFQSLWRPLHWFYICLQRIQDKKVTDKLNSLAVMDGFVWTKDKVPLPVLNFYTRPADQLFKLQIPLGFGGGQALAEDGGCAHYSLSQII